MNFAKNTSAMYKSEARRSRRHNPGQGDVTSVSHYSVFDNGLVRRTHRVHHTRRVHHSFREDIAPVQKQKQDYAEANLAELETETYRNTRVPRETRIKQKSHQRKHSAKPGHLKPVRANEWDVAQSDRTRKKKTAKVQQDHLEWCDLEKRYIDVAAHAMNPIIEETRLYPTIDAAQAKGNLGQNYFGDELNGQPCEFERIVRYTEPTLDENGNRIGHTHFYRRKRHSRHVRGPHSHKAYLITPIRM